MIRIRIVRVEGSAPRDVGTAMLVSRDSIEGTIGGGALEYTAIAHARDLLGRDTTRELRSFALGPNLGQCCGGRVTLLFERAPFEETSDKLRPCLMLYGAGHVGRAVIRAAEGLPLTLFWIDMAADRFPETIPESVTRVVAADPTIIAAHAEAGAMHLVMTYSHAIDFAICHTVLTRRDFSYLGVIGSETKRARFVSRLAELGLSENQIARLRCPIGDPAIRGKEPAVIAISVLAELLTFLSQPVAPGICSDSDDESGKIGRAG